MTKVATHRSNVDANTETELVLTIYIIITIIIIQLSLQQQRLIQLDYNDGLFTGHSKRT